MIGHEKKTSSNLKLEYEISHRIKLLDYSEICIWGFTCKWRGVAPLQPVPGSPLCLGVGSSAAGPRLSPGSLQQRSVSAGHSPIAPTWARKIQVREKGGEGQGKDKEKSKRRLRGLLTTWKTQQSEGTHFNFLGFPLFQTVPIILLENKHAIFMRFAVDLLFTFMNSGRGLGFFLAGGLIGSSQSEEKLISTFPFSLDETELLTWAFCLSFLHQSEALSWAGPSEGGRAGSRQGRPSAAARRSSR